MTLRRVGQGQNLIVAYHAVAAGHPDAAALQVLSGVMNGGGGGRGGRGGGGGAQEGRLAKALVDTKLAQSASMGFQQLHDPGPGPGLRDARRRISRSTRRATPSTRRSTTS